MPKIANLVAVIGILSGSAAVAAPSLDPAGDFIATYTGPQNADLDVLSSQVLLNAGIFQFSAALAGPVGTTAGGFYVFGVDRGMGTARFGAIASNVLFDSVVVINSNGTGFTRDLLLGVSTTLAPSAISLTGSSISASVAAALLPSTGFAPAAYTYNLWPRSPGAGNGTIADFAPDNSNAAVTAVPEPQTWALLIAGFGLVGTAARRRRTVHAAA